MLHWRGARENNGVIIFLRVQNKVVKTYGVAVFVLIHLSFCNMDKKILLLSNSTDQERTTLAQEVCIDFGSIVLLFCLFFRQNNKVVFI